MTANTVTTYTAVGNRENLTNEIWRVAPEDTPFLSAIGKTAAKGRFHEWQTDTLSTVGSNALVEGADAVYQTQAPTVRVGNYTQILGTAFSVSNTQEAVDHAGMNELARAMSKNAIELKKDIEFATLINSTAQVGSSAAPRYMAGVSGWITSNYFGGAGGSAPVMSGEYPGTAAVAGTERAYTEALLISALTQTYTVGGNVKMLVVTPNGKIAMDGFSGGVTRMQDINGVKDVTLNTSYTIYGSPFGNVTIVPDRNIAGQTTSVFGIDTDMWALATLRAFETEEMAMTGDATNYQMRFEGTLESRNQLASFNIADLNNV
jgi:hypothetical protein